jgi:hypothetical protein
MPRTSISTSHRSTDPFRHSRLRPADGSFQNALTQQECDDAATLLASVGNTLTLITYLCKYPASLGNQDYHCPDAQYWHQHLCALDEC